MKSPSVLSSPTFAGLTILTLLASSGSSANALPLSPTTSSSLHSSPDLGTPPSSLPSSPDLSSSSPAFDDSIPDLSLDSGLGITIPLRKSEAYLTKRQLPVVDFHWLFKERSTVSMKYGGGNNYNSPTFNHSPLAAPQPDDSDEEEEAASSTVSPASSSVSSTATSTSSDVLTSSSQPSSTGNPEKFAAGPTTIVAATTSPLSTASPTTTTTPSAQPTFAADFLNSPRPTSSSAAPASSSAFLLRSPNSRSLKRANGGTLALSDQTTLWMGPMTVGGQEFQLDFDTGSSDLFVPGTQCTKDGCVGHKKYSTTKTARKMKGTFKISYGDGSSTSGPIYTESMSIAGLSITNQTFSPTTIMSPTFANTGDGNGYPADGIAGMGFPALSQTRTTPFFQTLVNQQKIASVFSFRLGHSGSELLLGGVNSNHYSGSINWTPVSQQAYWTIGVDGILINNQKVAGLQGQSSIIDTGTTLTYGSYDDVRTVYRNVPGAKDMSIAYGDDYKGYWTIPCGSIPSVAFGFGGKYWTINPKTFNLGKASSGSQDCVGALIGQDPNASGLGNTMLIGDAFLTNVYAVFDAGSARVGFAAPK